VLSSSNIYQQLNNFKAKDRTAIQQIKTRMQRRNWSAGGSKSIWMREMEMERKKISAWNFVGPRRMGTRCAWGHHRSLHPCLRKEFAGTAGSCLAHANEPSQVPTQNFTLTKIDFKTIGKNETKLGQVCLGNDSKKKKEGSQRSRGKEGNGAGGNAQDSHLPPAELNIKTRL